MAVVRANSVLLRADLLTDIEGLGSDDGITSDVVAWVDDQNNWYYPDTIGASTSTWTALSGGGSAVIPGQSGLQYEDAVFYVDTLNSGSLTTSSAWTDIISETEATAGTGITLVDGYWDFAFSGIFDFGALTAPVDMWAGGGTLCMWVNVQGTGTNFGGYILDKSDNSTDGWIVSVNNGATQIRFFAYFSGGLAQWAFTHGLGVPTDFFHLAIVYDSDDPTNDPTFYVNGIAQSLATDVNSSGTYDSDVSEPLKVGGAAASNYFDGQMRGAWLYDSAFTADQVNAHYRVTAPPLTPVASPLADVLVVGNTTGGNDIIVSSGDEIITADQTAGGATDSLTVRAGDVSGGFGNAGATTLRGGDTSTSGGAGGNLTIRGGSSGSTGSGETLVHGGDPTAGGTGSPGRLILRAGDRVATGAAGTGASAGLKAGSSFNNTGGNLFLRSGSPITASTGGTSGGLFIGTQTAALGVGDPFGDFEPGANTGSISFSTNTQNFSTVNTSGNISFTIGDTYAVTGNNPGDFTFTGGSFANANNFATATSMTITLGSGSATTGGGGGSFTVTAGDNTNTGSAFSGTAVAGGIFLTAGDSSLTGGNAFGGPVEITAGSGVGTNTNGGPVEITAGAGTGTELGGSIVLTAGLGASAANHGRTVISQDVGNESEILELDSTGGTDGWIVDMYVSAVQPNGAVTGNAGDVCFVSTGPGTAGELWIKESGTATNTGWGQVATGATVSNLQTAYEGGNAIVTDSTNGDFDVSGTEAISLSSTGSDVTLETASTTVPGNVIITGGGATAGPGGDITLTGGDVTAGAGGVGGAITATAGDSFGAFDGGDVTFTAGQGGATNNGGDALVQGGSGGATSGNGGRADLFGGDATTDGQGGIAAVLGGTAAGNNAGGAAGVTGGTGSGTGAGGAAVLTGGTPGATGAGGPVTINGGAGGSTSGAGGTIFVTGGSVTSGVGGGFVVTCANSSAANQGGGIGMDAGNSSSGLGGLINIQAGDSATGTGGSAAFQGGDNTSSGGSGGGATVRAGDGTEGGGTASLVGGNSTTDGTGGDVFVLGGSASSGVGSGGNVEIGSGDGLGTSGVGGEINLTIGNTTGTNSAGADITMTAGDGNGTGNGGSIVLNPGSATGTGTDGEVTINGKLTVTGIIDPTGLVLDEVGAVPFSTTAGMGTVWLRNDAPNTLMFTNDAGESRGLVGGYSVSGVVPLNDSGVEVCLALGSSRSDASAYSTSNITNSAAVVNVTVLSPVYDSVARVTLRGVTTGSPSWGVTTVRMYRNRSSSTVEASDTGNFSGGDVIRHFDLTSFTIPAGTLVHITAEPTTGDGDAFYHVYFDPA